MPCGVNFLYKLKRFVVFPNDASADPTRKCGGKAMTQEQQRQYGQCSSVFFCHQSWKVQVQIALWWADYTCKWDRTV